MLNFNAILKFPFFWSLFLWFQQFMTILQCFQTRRCSLLKDSSKQKNILKLYELQELLTIYLRRRSASFALNMARILGNTSSVRHLHKLCSFRDFEFLNLFAKFCQSSSVKHTTCHIRSRLPCFCFVFAAFRKSSRYKRVPGMKVNF